MVLEVHQTINITGADPTSATYLSVLLDQFGAGCDHEPGPCSGDTTTASVGEAWDYVIARVVGEHAGEEAVAYLRKALDGAKVVSGQATTFVRPARGLG